MRLNIQTEAQRVITRQRLYEMTPFLKIPPPKWESLASITAQKKSTFHWNSWINFDSLSSLVSFTTRQRSFGKVIFSVVSACLSFCQSDCSPGGTLLTTPHMDMFKLGTRSPIPPTQPQSICWPPFYTCENGWLVFDWKAFLFTILLNLLRQHPTLMILSTFPQKLQRFWSFTRERDACICGRDQLWWLHNHTHLHICGTLLKWIISFV